MIASSQLCTLMENQYFRGMMSASDERHVQAYIKHLSHLTPAEVDFLRPHIGVKSYQKKEFFLQKGEVQKGLGFVLNGLIRRYYINDKGNDITTGFIKEYAYVTDYPAFIRQIPTKYFLQCLEPSVIVTVPFEIIQKSYQEFEHGQLYGRLMAEQTLTLYNDRIEGFLFNTAEERYLKFLQEQPSLMNRVSLTHLSSFLGIERQSLSRIRKRIASK